MNFFISIVGWLIWNIAEAQIEKGEKDNDGNDVTAFSYKDYAKRHTLIWLGSLLCIPVLLWIGYRNLDISPAASLLGMGDSKMWHDLYILGAGAAFEAFIFAVKKIKSFFKKKEKDL